MLSIIKPYDPRFEAATILENLPALLICLWAIDDHEAEWALPLYSLQRASVTHALGPNSSLRVLIALLIDKWQ